MSLIRLEYWTIILTIVIDILIYFGGGLVYDSPEQIVFWLILSYLIAFLIYPYFKKYFFRKTVIFDFVGVVADGNADDYYKGRIRIRTGMRQLIAKLKRNNKVVLFTNNAAEAHWAFVQKFSLDTLFDFNFASAEIGMKKPEASAYAKILREVGSRPSDSVMIDDTPENLSGAKAIGMHTIHFTTMEKCVEELCSLGYKV